MASFYGMDIEQVEQLAVEFEHKAQDVDSIVQVIEGRLSSTDWRGPDADRFRNDWSGTLAPGLRNVAEVLREAAHSSRQNAEEQRTISS